MILALATGPLTPALQAIGWALLHLVWQGAAIAVALALLLALLPSRSANVRYVMSCAALALVVVAGVLTGLRSYAANAPQPGTAVQRPAPHVERALARTSAPPPSVASIVVATFAPARVPTIPDPWRAASDALPAIVFLWLAGVTVLSLRLIVQWLHARRLVTERAQPACEPWLAMSRRLGAALRVRHAVRLLESTAVQVPAVIGLVRPVILLPANSLTGLLPGQLEMILAHELAHIRRHDFLINLLQAAVETLLFYHPAVWWISKQVRIEREYCCDDLAVSVCGNPLQYARALARLEELRADVVPLALSARGGSLLHRIRRVVSGPAISTGPVRGVTALALLVGLLLAFGAPSLTAIARPQGAASSTPRSATAYATKAEAAKATASARPATEVSAQPATEASARSAAEASAQPAAEASAQASPEGGCTDATVASGDAGNANPDDAEADLEPNSTEAIAHGRIRLTVDDLIQLRAQGVTTDDILEMRSVFPRIHVREIAGMYAVGATPEYVREMVAAGIDVRSPSEAQSMAAVGVTPEFIADMRSAGLEVKCASAASGLAAVGVTSEFIRGMRAAGLTVASADEAKGLAAVGVTPEYITRMRATGLKLASASEAQSLCAVGVTPDYVREMRAAGVPIHDASQAQSLVAVGVTPQFVRRLARAGYSNLSVSDLCRLGAGGVADSFIEEMSQYRAR